MARNANAMARDQRKRSKLAPGEREWIKAKDKIDWLENLPEFKAYERSAGEAEARAVQHRRDFTPEQRKELYPWGDYDVPEKELLLDPELLKALSKDIKLY